MFRKLKNSELVRLSVQQYRDAAKEPFVLVLDNVRSQHNIGSAFRTCDAFRIGRICLCGISATPPTPEIHKAALGAEFSVDWVHFDTALEAVAALRAENYTIVSVEQAEHFHRNRTLEHNFEQFPIDSKKSYYICSPIREIGKWRSWLARCVRDAEVGCSSHLFPTDF